MSPRKVRLGYIHNVTEEEEVVGGLSEHFLHTKSALCRGLGVHSVTPSRAVGREKDFLLQARGRVSAAFPADPCSAFMDGGKRGAGEVVLMCKRSIICTCLDSVQNKPPQPGALTLIWKCTDNDKKKKYPKFKSEHDEAST